MQEAKTAKIADAIVGSGVRVRRRRAEVAFIILFAAANVVLPLWFRELYPFTIAPMFSDSPRQCSEFEVFGTDGRSLPLGDFELERVYDGNPPGLGNGIVQRPTLARFGAPPTDEAIRSHVAAMLERDQNRSLSHVEVVHRVVGPVDSHRIGVIRESRLRVDRTP